MRKLFNSTVRLFTVVGRGVPAVTVPLQIVATCKQSGYKQSGCAEPARLSNGQGWAGAAGAREAKQSRLGSGRARMRKQAISLRAAGAQKF